MSYYLHKLQIHSNNVPADADTNAPFTCAKDSNIAPINDKKDDNNHIAIQ